MPDLALLVSLLKLATKDRTQLALENTALRHQLAVYKRSVKRPSSGHRSDAQVSLSQGVATPRTIRLAVYGDVKKMTVCRDHHRQNQSGAKESPKPRRETAAFGGSGEPGHYFRPKLET